jgi:predicted transcriptional regulator
MSATTIRLPVVLKRRIASAARRAGKSPHAFMLEAISAETRRAEMRRKFIDDALAADAEMERTGRGYAWEDVKAYLEAKVAGKPVRRPRPRRWRR